MKRIRFRKLPFLYGASFLLDIFGPNAVVRRRSFNVGSDGSSSIRNGFNRVATRFAKVMRKQQA